MNNIFELLPGEILRHILLYLERKSIKFMFEISARIKKLDLEEILNTRKIVACPRSSGRCLVHRIPALTFIKLIHKSQGLIKWLDDTDEDLVKNDMIICDAMKYLFDGDKIICIYDRFREINCPRVIQNDIPMLYYEHVTMYVYFDHSLVKDQCIINIQYGLMTKDKYGIFTTFVYNNNKYKIVFDYINRMVIDYYDQNTYEFLNKQYESDIIEIFIRLLSSKCELIFKYESIAYGFDIDNVLFLDIVSLVSYGE